MTKADRFQKLGVLTQLMRDKDMAKLQNLSSMHAQTLEKLTRLGRMPDACADPAMFKVEQAHLRWATQQKMQLNVTLAAQRAALLEQKRRAARSIGRADAIARLLKPGRQKL